MTNGPGPSKRKVNRMARKSAKTRGNVGKEGRAGLKKANRTYGAEAKASRKIRRCIGNTCKLGAKLKRKAAKRR